MAALLLGFSVLLTAEATIATTDAVLLATVMGARACCCGSIAPQPEGARGLDPAGDVGLGRASPWASWSRVR